jgi:hypothetical protein
MRVIGMLATPRLHQGERALLSAAGVLAQCRTGDAMSMIRERQASICPPEFDVAA